MTRISESGYSLTTTAVLLLAGAALTAPAPAQELPHGPYREEIEVRVIDLEAVVTDRDGQRVSGLELKNFRLLVDGEEVPIEYFSEIRDGGVIQSEKGVPGLVDTESVGTSFLLFIDDFFGLHNDKGRVMQAVAERTEHMKNRRLATTRLTEEVE